MLFRKHSKYCKRARYVLKLGGALLLFIFRFFFPNVPFFFAGAGRTGFRLAAGTKNWGLTIQDHAVRCLRKTREVVGPIQWGPIPHCTPPLRE